MEYKDFIKLTNTSIKKYTSQRFYELMHREENHSRIFEMVVKSYYMWDINKAPDKTKTATTYAIYRGKFAIQTIIREFKLHKKQPTINLEKVEHRLESPLSNTYHYNEREAEARRLTNFYIENSGLTQSELKYVKLFGEGYSFKEIAEQCGIRVQYVSHCVQQAKRKINRHHEFPEI